MNIEYIHLTLPAIIYLAFNALTLLLYVIDKVLAKLGWWRVPEATLLLLTIIGGSLGALLGMVVANHKTNHVLFRILVPLSFVLHVVVYFVLIK